LSKQEIPSYRPQSGRNSSRGRDPSPRNSRDSARDSARDSHRRNSNANPNVNSGGQKHQRAGSSDGRNSRMSGGRPMWWQN